jgi:hypothetical protein
LGGIKLVLDPRDIGPALKGVTHYAHLEPRM